MKDMRREVLNQVASGTISAEEGARRLEAMDAPAPPPTPPASSAASVAASVVEPSPIPAAPTAGAVRKVKVTSQFGAADIVGDPSVASAVADGPHRARQEGDVMVIEHAPFEESNTFTFGRGGERRIILDGFDWHRRKLVVRMNPDLELVATVQAGNVNIEGVHGAIEAEVQAGNCRVADFRGPLTATVQAGNVTASGRLDHGTSKLRCEMGSVKVALDKGSSVKITARSQLGRISIEGDGSERVIGGTGKEVTVGSGEGMLDIDCTMGNVRLTVD